MKKTLTLALFLLIAALAFGTIWQVNNNPGMVADFTSLSDALNSSNVIAGDTLYVYGSPTSYGTHEISKRITIIGPGYFLNQNPGLQSNITPATVGMIHFIAGSEGSLISGVTCSSYIQSTASNVVVQRNNIRQAYIYGANCLLLQNYIYPTPDYTYSVYVAGTNTTIGNNWIHRSAGGWCLYMEDNAGGTIYNNFIYGGCRFRNCDVYNNTVQFDGYGWELPFSIDASTYMHHNVLCWIYSWDWYTSVPALGPGNLYNVTEQIYVGSGSNDAYYQLCTGSPAIGAGLNGEDCGIFGGSSPYKLSGIPAIPTISEFIAPATGFTIPVQITARSNN